MVSTLLRSNPCPDTGMQYSIWFYRVESEESGEILVNAPASFDKGRPGGGHHGGGHHGGGHHQQAHGGWNCCLFAKAYCKLPCHGKLCKEKYFWLDTKYWSLSYPSRLDTKYWTLNDAGTQTCTVKCFPFGWVTCDPIPCQVTLADCPAMSFVFVSWAIN